jgi:hypothetical protein
VSVSIPSSILRAFQSRQESSTPVGPQSAPGAAPAQAPVSSPASAPRAFSTDGFEQASTQQQEWAAKFAAGAGLPPLGSSGVVQQTQDNNCGAAATIMAAGSKGRSAGVSDEQRMAQLESTFTEGKGTTPEQLSKMLAHEGVSVKQAAFKFDQHTLDQALSKGGKLLVMVDSNQIAPGADKQADGRPHWVVVDGKDAQGNYSVKDPGTGSSYGVDFNQLNSAVDNGWWKHQGGGTLIVENAPVGMSEAALADANSKQIVPLAATEGGGSKAEKSFGRESS